MAKWKLIAISLLLLGGVVYLSAFADPSSEPAPVREESLKRVRVAAVEEVEGTREARFPGVTRAARRARVAFVIGGRMVSRPAEVGDRVTAGQVVARIDDSELKNAVLTAEGALAELAARRAQTERDRDRAERLYGAKATTREEVEKASAAVEALSAAEESASARLQEARRLLAEADLRSPFAGTVTEVLLEPGEHAAPGRPVVVLSGDGEIEIEVEVPESVLQSIRRGDEVTASFPVLGIDAVTGHVKSVGRAAAGPGRLFPVVVLLEPHPIVAPGMTAELVLRIHSGRGASLAVPVEAVVNPGGRRPAVFRLSAEAGEVRVEKLRVDVADLLGDKVVLRGPLLPNDRVVVGGQQGLLDGERVEVF